MLLLQQAELRCGLDGQRAVGAVASQRMAMVQQEPSSLLEKERLARTLAGAPPAMYLEEAQFGQDHGRQRSHLLPRPLGRVQQPILPLENSVQLS